MKQKLDATPLLALIDAYCERTDTPPGYVGKIAFNHPGYVPLIRKRGVTSPEANERVRTVMAENPDGITEAAILQAKLLDVRSPVGRKVQDSLNALKARRDQMDSMPRVERDPCHVCGARGDFECGHRKGSWGTGYGV